MIGFLSQLTHCIAITLMTCNDKENMEKFTGDSFRDLTRIARIIDLMWSELFVANKDMLLDNRLWLCYSVLTESRVLRSFKTLHFVMGCVEARLSYCFPQV